MTVSDMTPAAFRAWMKARGWTEVQAAQELGVTRASIARYKSGRRSISDTIKGRCEDITTIADLRTKLAKKG